MIASGCPPALDSKAPLLLKMPRTLELWGLFPDASLPEYCQVLFGLLWGKHLSGLTQSWRHNKTQTCQTRCAHWCHSSRTVYGLTHYFLVWLSDILHKRELFGGGVRRVQETRSKPREAAGFRMKPLMLLCESVMISKSNCLLSMFTSMNLCYSLPWSGKLLIAEGSR